MIKLNDYNKDGACHQAQAVLAYLKDLPLVETDTVVGRWSNFREQGYVISLRINQNQLNIAFFEHRNTDSIHAVRWEAVTEGTPTLDDIDFTRNYKDKNDTDYSVDYGKALEMADWIHSEITEYIGD